MLLTILFYFQINYVITHFSNKMCDHCDAIRCLRDSCPGLDGCRLCGNCSYDFYHEHYKFPRPSTVTKFSKVPSKCYRRPWFFASKFVWKSDFLCKALWCVALLMVSRASAEQHYTQISNSLLSTPPTNTNTSHIPEGRSKLIICEIVFYCN